MVAASILFLAAAALLGYRIISAVPPMLHTPLMSGMNALSGITVLGTLTVFATATTDGIRLAAGAALILAMLNVAGGFWVTERMLSFFKAREGSPDKEIG
jgi:H+-translocating NAD(P) transhydrogenase subunit alpha